MARKYIFVTGGVVSGLGKGLAAASLGRLLKARGYKIVMQKFDPYINYGTAGMSPAQQGELFVTEDGGEANANLGHYERFVDEALDADSNITTGRIYYNVISKEREGLYGGETLQVIPHITSEIKSYVYKAGEKNDADIVITDIGGTVGDIENQPFLEAMRQVASEVGEGNSLFMHASLVPFISGSSELKTKPTQHSVKELLSIGIQPQVLVCRCGLHLDEGLKKKIALFCNTRSEDVIEQNTAASIYQLPLMLEKEGLAKSVCFHLGLENRTPDLDSWKKMVEKDIHPTDNKTVAIVGKYIERHKAYLSIEEALHHAGIEKSTAIDFKWVSIDADVKELEDVDGVILADDTADCLNGYENIAAYCRENKKPILGIGYGMFGLVIDIAKNKAGIADAGSTEFGGGTPVISHLIDAKTGKGPTMRKGLFPVRIAKDSIFYKYYTDEIVNERHHCSYELNMDYAETIEDAGLFISAASPDSFLAEAVELKGHPFYVGIQFTPQFSSRPSKPHPIFAAFLDKIK